MRYLICFIGYILSISLANAQVDNATWVVSGKVLEDKNGLPLAFVTIVVNNGKDAVLTDIDGKFNIKLKYEPKQLNITYLGYEKIIHTLVKTQTTGLVFKMKKTGFNLKEVVVKAGENPAHRLIRAAVLNRNLNDPKSLNAYSYVSYNKFVFTADTLNRFLFDTTTIATTNAAAQPTTTEKEQKNQPKKKRKNKTAETDSLAVSKPDSSGYFLQQYLEKRHLFLTEAVTECKYRFPEMQTEKILANRISGFQNPLFSMLATQIQSFSFYQDLIEILSSKYVNPISSGSLNKYSFNIEDTTWQGNDTVYIISFKPAKGKNFKGLRGVIYLNTFQYAVQNVLAEPAEQDESLYIKIQQQYTRIGDHWFPDQINTDMVLKNVNVNGFKVQGLGRTYLRSIKINEPIAKKEVRLNGIEIDKNVAKRDETYWDTYRTDSLSTKDKNTYSFLDSVSKANNIEKKFKVLIALTTGRLPLGSVDLMLNKLANFNLLEGWRLGAGFITNDKISKSVALGAWAGYGLKDRQWKYGAQLYYYLNQRKDNNFQVQYWNDLTETATYSFFELNGKLINSFRGINLFYLDWNRGGQLLWQFNTSRFFSGQVGLQSIQKRIVSQNTYAYYPEGYVENTQGIRTFDYTTLNINVRYAFREKYIKTPAMLVSLGTKWPVLNLNFIRGVSGVLNGQYAFNKLEFRVNKAFDYKYLGRTILQAVGGVCDAKVPLTEQFFGRGTTNMFSIYVPFAFQTMNANEFLNNRFVHCFVVHTFRNLLLKKKNFDPEVAVAFAAGWGELNQAQNHYRFPVIPLQDMRKGYYEGGVMLNNLMKNTFQNLGIGGFYRMGAYGFEKPIDNLTLKLTSTINF